MYAKFTDHMVGHDDAAALFVGNFLQLAPNQPQNTDTSLGSIKHSPQRLSNAVHHNQPCTKYLDNISQSLHQGEQLVMGVDTVHVHVLQ
jgi:uncharacterized SAM-dependent methyltransferase